jgi:hypothetical protein
MLTYVLVGHRISTFNDTKLMMIIMIMTILTIIIAKSRESRVLYSYKNDANISNFTPGNGKIC